MLSTSITTMNPSATTIGTHSAVIRARRSALIERMAPITDKTVRNHVSMILLKLDVNDRTAAALKARDAGL